MTKEQVVLLLVGLALPLCGTGLGIFYLYLGHVHGDNYVSNWPWRLGWVITIVALTIAGFITALYVGGRCA